jgi:hypothetical protein
MDPCVPIALAMLGSTEIPLVRGVVVAVQTISREQSVFSTYVVAVEETFRGDAPAEVHLALPGGDLGDRAQRAHGWPLWHVGDDVLAFVPDGGRVPAHAAWSVGRDGRLGEDLWLVDVEEAVASAR